MGSQQALFRSVVAQVRASMPEGVSAEDLEAFLARHANQLRQEIEGALADQPAVPPGTNLWDHYGASGAPQPGERGYRPPFPAADLAERVLDEALLLLDDSEALWLWQAAQAGPGSDGYAWEDEEAEVGIYGPDELADFLGLPTRIPATRRRAASVIAVNLAMQVEGRALSEHGEAPDGRLARWVAVGILEDGLRAEAPLRLVNVDRETARAFIARHHTTLPYLNPRGLMYAIGAEKGGRLVAVATAGSPTGRWSRIDPRNVLELTRVASDGSTKNAASMLIARLLDLRERSRRGRPGDPALFVTYQLSEEEGAVYRALQDKGLRCVGLVPGRAPGGARAGSEANSKPSSLAHIDKYRWEAE